MNGINQKVGGMLGRLAASVATALAVVSLATSAQAYLFINMGTSGLGSTEWEFSGFDYKWTTHSTARLLHPWNRTTYYVQVNGTNHDSVPQCYEVETHPGKTTANPDTVIWHSYSGQALALSDDRQGTFQSKVRVWLDVGNYFFLYVSAYGTNHESQDFKVSITRLALNYQSCTSGQTTIPWVRLADDNYALNYGNLGATG